MIIQSIIRLQVFINAKDNFFDVYTGGTPEAWKSTDIVFQIGLFKGTKANPVLVTAEDLSELAQIALKTFVEARTGAPFMDGAVDMADFDTTLDADSWTDGSKQHISIPFSASENNHPIPDGSKEANFWLVVHGISNTDPVKYPTFGGTQFKQIRDGVRDNEDSSAPVQAGNIIPAGSAYDGGGEFTLNVTTDRTYFYTKGANDTELTNGDETVVISGALFSAATTFVTLVGTPGALITAIIRPDQFLTVDQSDARYFLKNTTLSNDADLRLVSGRKVTFGKNTIDQVSGFSYFTDDSFHHIFGGGGGNDVTVWAAKTDGDETTNGILQVGVGLQLPGTSAFKYLMADTNGIVVSDDGTYLATQLEPIILTILNNALANTGIRFKNGQFQWWDPTAYAADNTKPWRAIGVDGGVVGSSAPITT